MTESEFETEAQEYAAIVLKNLKEGKTTIEKVERTASWGEENRPHDPLYAGYSRARDAFWQRRREGNV